VQDTSVATSEATPVADPAAAPVADLAAAPVADPVATPVAAPAETPVESPDESKAADHTPPSPVSNGIKDTSAEPAILADKYKAGTQFINESLAGKKQDISSKIQSAPISNIGSALGVNDRFKLINDLFNGDKDSFQKTIGILNGAANFNEAFNYITSSFDWDMEEDSVQLLLELVRRKFIVNQNE